MPKIFIAIICSFFITANVFAALDITDNVAITDDISNRLIIVEEKINAVQSQVNQLEEHLNVIEQNSEQVRERNLENKGELSEKLMIAFKPMQQYLNKLAANLGIDPQLFIISIIGVIFLLLIYLLFRRRSAASCSDNSMAVKDEYNIMENREGVAAKLNLARTYIAMGKTTEAQVMLQTVLANGKPAEQAEAKELLEKIMKTV